MKDAKQCHAKQCRLFSCQKSKCFSLRVPIILQPGSCTSSGNIRLQGEVCVSLRYFTNKLSGCISPHLTSLQFWGYVIEALKKKPFSLITPSWCSGEKIHAGVGWNSWEAELSQIFLIVPACFPLKQASCPLSAWAGSINTLECLASRVMSMSQGRCIQLPHST